MGLRDVGAGGRASIIEGVGVSVDISWRARTLALGHVRPAERKPLREKKGSWGNPANTVADESNCLGPAGGIKTVFFSFRPGGTGARGLLCFKLCYQQAFFLFQCGPRGKATSLLISIWFFSISRLGECRMALVLSTATL
jgi:hypothetical protein